MSKGKKIMIVLLAAVVVLMVIALLFLLLWPSFGRSPSKEQQNAYAQQTDAFYDSTFHTPEDFQLIVDVEEQEEDAEEEVRPSGRIPVEKITELPLAEAEDLKITWFGHSTSLLQIHGMTVLIDPVLGEYASPVGFMGAKRMAEVPMEAEALPEIDVLLISHDHYDHLDDRTIKKIDAKVKSYCVPLGVENHLIRWGVNPDKIHVMAWWDEIEINGLVIGATPGQHYSGRLPWKQNNTLWCGYVLKNAYHNVYYTGDTGYGEFFQEIRNRYGSPELVISEDGQYNPKWPDCHMFPQEVIQAAEDLGTEWVLPVHWAGFALAEHAWDDPAEQLTLYAETSQVSAATPRIGETVDFAEIERYQEKWWRSVDDMNE